MLISTRQMEWQAQMLFRQQQSRKQEHPLQQVLIM